MSMSRTHIKDYTGIRFGRLTVISEPAIIKGPFGSIRIMLCRCDCGAVKTAKLAILKKSKMPSCGCYQREAVSSQFKKHGSSFTKEYRCWADMKQRCLNPRNKAYGRYGARGIKVCERWMKFENFRDDMGPRPEGFSIERINNDGNYEPSNCKWADMKEQCSNTRQNRWFNGKTHTQIARELGVTQTCIRRRAALGLPILAAKHSFARGEFCSSAKLTMAQVLEIRDTWKPGSTRDMAARFSVCEKTVLNAAKRRTFK